MRPSLALGRRSRHPLGRPTSPLVPAVGQAPRARAAGRSQPTVMFQKGTAPQPVGRFDPWGSGRWPIRCGRPTRRTCDDRRDAPQRGRGGGRPGHRGPDPGRRLRDLVPVPAPSRPGSRRSAERPGRDRDRHPAAAHPIRPRRPPSRGVVGSADRRDRRDLEGRHVDRLVRRQHAARSSATGSRRRSARSGRTRPSGGPRMSRARWRSPGRPSPTRRSRPT